MVLEPNATFASGTGVANQTNEDLEQLISNIDRSDTPFTSSIGMSKAKNSLHVWLTDEYAAPSDICRAPADRKSVV